MPWPFRREPVVIGVVHLPPLPGSPRGGDVERAVDSAIRDATALEEGGVDGVIVENLGDAPYASTDVPKVTVAAMTRVVSEVVHSVDVPVGVNVLRSDGVAAVDVCAATGAEFVRVNAYVEALATDQGLLNPVARDVIMERMALGLEDDVAILADVRVKHASPLDDRPLEEVVADAVERGLADAVIVTGSRTGSPANPKDVERASSVGDRILVGSGVTPENVVGFLKSGAVGFIVGTWFKRGDDVFSPVDPSRVRELVETVRGFGRAKSDHGG